MLEDLYSNAIRTLLDLINRHTQLYQTVKLNLLWADRDSKSKEFLRYFHEIPVGDTHPCRKRLCLLVVPVRKKTVARPSTYSPSANIEDGRLARPSLPTLPG